MTLLATAPSLEISGTVFYSAYVAPISPYTTALIDYYTRAVSINVAAGWLIWLLFAGEILLAGAQRRSMKVRYTGAGVAVAAGLLNWVAEPTSSWWGVRNVAAAALFGALTLALTRWSGGSREQLGISPPNVSTARGRAQALAVGATVGLAALITSQTLTALPAYLPATGIVDGGSQVAFLGWTNTWLQTANVAFTGVIEDVVMVGAVACLLGRARRRTWEMYALSLVLEVGMHLYLGLPAIAIVVVAAVSLALFRATGRLTPIVVAHVAFDLSTTLPVPAWGLGLLLAVTASVATIFAAVCAPSGRTTVDAARKPEASATMFTTRR
ncbi:CPBP family glutamic-type intramembrane protease [Streptomyces tubercidicus]|uniref:CPBP family glutamic-type intramembrane protease n=1 Tax=Streptomyces tubercidicus TaxID=47759 RepID=UPI0037AF06C9